MRSFIAWEVLTDSSSKGCYEQTTPQIIYDSALAILLLEAGLNAEPDGKSALKVLLTNPALFPFQLPIMTGDFIGNSCERIKVVRYGMDDELLELKK